MGAKDTPNVAIVIVAFMVLIGVIGELARQQFNFAGNALRLPAGPPAAPPPAPANAGGLPVIAGGAPAAPNGAVVNVPANLPFAPVNLGGAPVPELKGQPVVNVPVNPADDPGRAK